MTLTLTLPDLETKEVARNLAKKRVSDWQMAALRKTPIRIKSPIQSNGKTIRAVVLTGLEQKEKGYRLTFNPVWARCYRGCHARREDLRILVVEFEDETVQFDTNGRSKSQFTTNGAGVGREAEEEAEAFFALLCEDDEGNDISKAMLSYVSRKYGAPKPILAKLNEASAS